MSKLMSVLGIILLAIGVALAVVGIVNPAQTQILGVSMDTAAIMGVGGVLSLGLGALIGAVEHMGFAKPAVVAEEIADVVEVVEVPEPEIIAAAKPDLKNVFVPRAPEPQAVPEVVEAPVEQPSRIRFPGFGRRIAATTAVATGTVAATTEAVETSLANVTPSVQETIEALEKAKSDINNAMSGVTTITEPPPVAVEAPADIDEPEAEEEVAAEGELYVLEEKTIRGRPARVLSDNTVEAETDEGWMRFENLEHLNEYLDSMGETA